MTTYLLRAFAVALAIVSANSVAGGPAGPVPSLQIKPLRTALFDLAASGNQVVAVGERGVVLHSQDEGTTWNATPSPTTRSLTSIIFPTEKLAIAAGHGATLMRSEDGGNTWQEIKVAEIGRDAILGLLARKDGKLNAYGAFGMYLESGDAGKTWKKLPVVKEGFDRHISQVIEFGDKLFLVGESGTMAMSADKGATWAELKSPYEGSYFGTLALPDGSLLVFGMRGNIFRSTDGGASWTKVPIPSVSTLNAGTADVTGRVILVGNNGLIAVSRDQGQTFALSQAREGLPLAKAVFRKDGSILYVGFLSTGIKQYPEK